ncbi:MAG: hypothetical protein LBO09_00740 [Candidatus Peribacteria bacterium]|nr:hypothetical protein [Candidatus Peribacteria bacterium]
MIFSLLTGVLIFNVGCAPVDQETKDQQEKEKNIRKGLLFIYAENLKEENQVFVGKTEDIASKVWRTGDTLYWKLSIDTVGVLGTAKFIGCSCDYLEVDHLHLKTEVIDKTHQFAYDAKLEAKNVGEVEFSLERDVILNFEITKEDFFPTEVWMILWLAFLASGIFITCLFCKALDAEESEEIFVSIVLGGIASAVLTLAVGGLVAFDHSWSSGILYESSITGVSFFLCLYFWTQGWRRSLAQSRKRKKAAQKEAREEKERARLRKEKEEKDKFGPTY